MDVLHIDSEKTWRGGENQVRLLADGLQQEGVTNTIATPPGSALAKRLSSSHQILEVPMRGEFNLNAAKKISHYCKQNRVDLLDCQSSHAHSIGLWCKRLFCPEIKIVVHRRVDYVPKPGWLNRVKYFNKGVDCYVAISDAIRNVLLNYGIEAQKVKKVFSAVDHEVYRSYQKPLEKEKWCQKLGLSTDTVLIGQAAAMTHQKGYETLLHSLSYLQEHKSKFHCVIAGDGELRQKLEKLCRDLDLSDQVSFLGWIDEVPSFLSSLDIFAMPSRFEGLGTVALEAVYAHSCLVTTKVGGLKEINIHNSTGLCAPVDCSKSFAAQLERAILSSDLRKDLSRQAYEYCITKFSLKSMVGNNLKIYRELLSQKV